jgi:hypothetical protein
LGREDVGRAGKWYHLATADDSAEIFLGLFCDSLAAVLPDDKAIDVFMKEHQLNGDVRVMA